MSFLLKGIVVYLLLAIAATFWAPALVFSGGTASDQTVLSWFNVGLDGNNLPTYNQGDPYGTNSAAKTASDAAQTEPKLSGGILTFMDPIIQVWQWIKTLFKVIFSPIIILTSAGAVPGTPAPIYLPLLFIFGLPLVALFIMSVIGWIRSGEM